MGGGTRGEVGRPRGRGEPEGTHELVYKVELGGAVLPAWKIAGELFTGILAVKQSPLKQEWCQILKSSSLFVRNLCFNNSVQLFLIKKIITLWSYTKIN